MRARRARLGLVGAAAAACAAVLAYASLAGAAPARTLDSVHPTTIDTQVCTDQLPPPPFQPGAAPTTSCESAVPPSHGAPRFCPGHGLLLWQHVQASDNGYGADSGSTTVSVDGSARWTLPQLYAQYAVTLTPSVTLAPGTHALHYAYSGGITYGVPPAGNVTFLPSSADGAVTIGCPLGAKAVQADVPATARGVPADVQVAWLDYFTGKDGCDGGGTYAFRAAGNDLPADRTGPCRWRVWFPDYGKWKLTVQAGNGLRETASQDVQVELKPCPKPTEVELTSPTAVPVAAGACLLLHASWAAEPANLDADLHAMDWGVYVDGKRLGDADFATRTVGGVAFGDAEAVVWKLAPGDHTAFFGARFTRDVATRINRYGNITAGSVFAGATTIRVSPGQSPRVPAKPPCPAELRADGSPFGPAGDGCSEWGAHSTPLALELADAVNPDVAGCGGATRSTSGARARADEPCSLKTPVAAVVYIEGRAYIRRASGKLEAARHGALLYVGDRFLTSPTSYAVAEFMVGGYISLNKGTIVRFTGARSADDDASRILRADSGRVWASLPKDEKPLLIRSPSTTIGIRG